MVRVEGGEAVPLNLLPLGGVEAEHVADFCYRLRRGHRKGLRPLFVQVRVNLLKRRATGTQVVNLGQRLACLLHGVFTRLYGRVAWGFRVLDLARCVPEVQVDE